MTRHILAASLLLLAGLACQPTPAPAPLPDAGDAGPTPDAAEMACGHLAVLGCTDGASPSCPMVVRHIEATHITRLDLACVRSAATKADAQRCAGAGVLCP